jgi:hypothetical protein
MVAKPEFVVFSSTVLKIENCVISNDYRPVWELARPLKCLSSKAEN